MDKQFSEQTIISRGPRKKWPWVVGGVVLFVAVLAVLIWFFAGRADAPKGTSTAAKNEFYTVLGNAAQQQRLKVSMYRATFASKADADAGSNPGSTLSSVSELDTKAAEYRSVFAHNLFDSPKFDIGRCIGKDTYNDNYKNDAERPDSLAKANSDLGSRVYKITQPLRFIPCPRLGILPQSAPDLATARLSDGVFPVTLSKEQAEAWVQKTKEADLFDVKDEGIVEHEGRQLRKISFSPKADDVNARLFDIFYVAADIERAKREHPNATWEFGFISVNPNNTGSVGGYYLVDEEKSLPAYSELYGTNPDKEPESSNSAGRNIARTKQYYEYLPQLTITPQTSLEFLE